MDDVKQFAERTPIGIESSRGKYADEPKVTDAERLLYGDLAEPVRLLGEATVAAEKAYSIVCKRRAEFPDADFLPERPFANEAEVENLDKGMVEAWDALVKMRLVYRNVAARASAQFLTEGANGLEFSGTMPVNGTSGPQPGASADPGVPAR